MAVTRNGSGALAAWIQRELDWEAPVARGARGASVRRVQEWLCLHGSPVAVDGDFGPATEAALAAFQRTSGLEENRVADERTFARLRAPLRDVLTPIAPRQRSFGEMVLAYALQHLQAHPVEVGGQNRGPWVRLYMEGHQGEEWPWCAGFVSFLMTQAAETLDVDMPIEGSISCDALAIQANAAARLIRAPGDGSAPAVGAGSLFLVRRTNRDWTHVGIATALHDGFFETVEGNTNDDGHREGFEVCARRRGYKKKDFVAL